MHIALENKAIIFRVKNDSSNLTPMMHFINNSFKNVKHLSNMTVVLDAKDELIRKRYLLKWAYKIFCKSPQHKNTLTFKQLNAQLSRPIHVVRTSNKFVEKTIRISVNHISKKNELRIRCNEHNPIIINSFEKLFKNSIAFSIDKRVFKIKITTKYDLAILKSILSRKKISGVSVVFITHGLNFSKLYSQDVDLEEKAYERKLEKSYKVLGIAHNSTSKEIKDSYKKMLRKYHPDKVCHEGAETMELYTKRFQVIQEAYQMIKENLKL
jgi:hypothetical protein